MPPFRTIARFGSRLGPLVAVFDNFASKAGLDRIREVVMALEDSGQALGALIDVPRQGLRRIDRGEARGCHRRAVTLSRDVLSACSRDGMVVLVALLVTVLSSRLCRPR